MSTPAVHLESMSKRYRAHSGESGFALESITLSIQSGSWIALTGRSGSGKTTLLQLMALLDRPDSGRVLLFGRDLTEHSESALSTLRRERLGFVYQQFHFIEHLSVWQNVTCRLVPAGVGAAERRARARELLGGFGLARGLDRRPRELSGGEQQRVALARALVANPDILFADEPTSNVDAATSELIVARIEGLRRSGTTVVISTHDERLVRPADRRYEIERGELVP
jgi:putative ABC transport system ATP-binding protein